MCRLFGFRSNVPSRAHRSLVAAENALARQACRHTDGWGIGYYQGDDAYVLKSDSGASSDPRFDKLTQRLSSHAFVVHVRRATVGGSDYFNSHPFRHGLWIFAHNGTLFGFDRLRERMLEHIRPDLAMLIFGSTDSEHLFFYLLSALDAAGIPDNGRSRIDAARAAEVLRAAVGRLFDFSREEGLDPPLVNFILTNGTVFFAQRAGIELYLASQKVTCKEYETCAEPNKVCMLPTRPLDLLSRRPGFRGVWRKVNHLIIASEPISEEDIWEELPEGTLVALGPEFDLHILPPAPAFAPCPSPPAPVPSPRAKYRPPAA